MKILDSSAMIAILRNDSVARSILTYLNDERPAITAFTVYEIFQSIRLDDLQKTFQTLEELPHLYFDTSTAVISSRLMSHLAKRGKKPGLVDLFIASICLRYQATLITLDKDFLEIPELSVKLIR
ncbi:MAG TPA: type II toxin-antitoxin system VapC family toxin [Candidatus Nanoarchaeia archaeon]|nr:type II toxin-antitoxin system VapC family toxin [Candidatus Nanoarchaeia archaeon]